MLELLARMDNILKRYGKVEAEEICIRDVVINEKKRTVHKNGVEISMQPMEFECLLVFWKYRNRVIRREQILNALFTWFLLLLMVTRMSHARICSCDANSCRDVMKERNTSWTMSSASHVFFV